MALLSGRLGGPVVGYDIRCDISNDAADGRVGGAFDGADLHLRREGGGEWRGRIGGSILGYNVDLAMDANHLTGRIGGATIGADIALAVASDPAGIIVTGRCGGPVAGFDCRLQWNPASGRLDGRLGGATIGFNLDLTADGRVQPLLAAAVACAAYYWGQMRRHKGDRVTAGSR